MFVSFAPEDSALAEWLSRRLTVEGYDVWCERFKALSNEPYPNDPDEAIKKKAFAVIALYSQASLQNPEITRQRSIALDVDKEQKHKFLIPINVDGVAPNQLDQITATLNFISFIANWAAGLRELLDKLHAIGCPKPLDNGGRFAIESYFEKRILSDQSEVLISNCLPIEKIPDVIHRVQTKRVIPDNRVEKLQTEWAFRRVDSRTFLSFHKPPLSLVTDYEMKPAGGAVWRHVLTVDDIKSRDLVVELIKKALWVKCIQKGLKYCPETYLSYFPIGLVEKEHLKFLKPDGSKSYVSATGQRKYPKFPESED
ncbi:toll/interleukin-1 receptor domain-containing protein, partial [bacterium]|nr:toll/interleukin-1 receptor domain-containing protein [bacterium]